jgi:hypothetical protein
LKVLVLAAGLVGLAAAGVLWSPGLLPLAPFTARGVAAGALVGAAGSLAGFLLVTAYRGAEMRRFQAALFGGMMLRLGIFGLALVVVLLRGGVSLKGFLFGLIPAYIGFQAAEIVHLQRQASRERGALTAEQSSEER